MRIDLGLVLGILLEYIFFIYYADTLFYRKRNKYICHAVIAAGYALHFLICILGNIILNTAIMIILHFLCLCILYHINKKNALFQSILLSALNMASEYLIIFIPYINIIPNEPSLITPAQSLILTLASKLLYLTGIMVLNRMFCHYKQSLLHSVSLGLLFIPIFTVVIIVLILNVNARSNLLSFICFILIIINIIVFAINQKMITMEMERNEIEEQRIKEKIDYDEYMLLKQAQQQTASLNHDLKEHIEILSALIGADNQAAQEYMRSLSNGIAKSQFIEYSDNKILNVLLSKKKEECQSKGIQFSIDPIQARLQFLNDMDTITIFSNLINNAIESCMKSKDKKIYLNIHTANESFIVIKIKNTAETKPIVINGKLKTHKNNAKLHGIGINSIIRTLNTYNGILTWEYKEEEKIFLTKIIMKNVTDRAVPC